MNKISKDFIGDNPETMTVGTITPISLSDKERRIGMNKKGNYIYGFSSEDVKQLLQEIDEYCRKNNTIPMKDLFQDLKKSNLKLAITDGGWVNCMSLMNFIKLKAGSGLI